MPIPPPQRRARFSEHARIAIPMLFTLIAGCAPKSVGVKPYYGETESLPQLVGDINANTEKLPTLWAKGDFDASIVDRGHRTNVNGVAYLMYARPQEMLFVGKADVLGEVFRMGSGSDKYWINVKGDIDTCWWGTYANLDRVDTKAIPVRPDLVEAVLGLDALETDLLRQPCPVLRFNNDQRAYMIVWNVKGPSQWMAQKEIWYDVDSKLPRLVNLFDGNGRVVLSAYLSDHKAVQVGDETAGAGGSGSTTRPSSPMVATNYRLFFPDTGSSLRLHLTDVRLESQGHPNAQNFAFDPSKAGATKVINIDESAR